jgi:hypothetical protein
MRRIMANLSPSPEPMTGRNAARRWQGAAALSLILLGGLLNFPARAWTPGAGSPAAVGGFIVDPTNRTDVLSFYNTIYTASQNYANEMNWAGSVANNMPGSTSATFKDDVCRRVNFYRALTGQNANITIDATESSNDQFAAIMMAAQNELSHTPMQPWADYTTTGANAAGSSNLALGTYGPGSIDGYMMDNGSNNSVVGHRRWILYSLSQVMGTGDIPPTGDGFYDGSGNNYGSANALWIMNNFAASATPKFIGWPSSGYVPFPLMPARWSLSYPNANFASATVTMSQNGTNVPVSIISNVDNGYGDNTIVWVPSSLPTSISADTPFTITVSGIGGGGPTSVTYTTTLFDPNVLGYSVTISGSSTPATTGATYTFNAVPEADSYNLKISTGSTAAWDEGAEDSPTPQIIADTTGSYPLRETGTAHTGSKAFQLAFPGDVDGSGDAEPYDFSDQSFQVTREVIPTASSQLQFYDLGRFATTTTTLTAQVSTDNGLTWATIWTRAGVGLSSADWDASFVQNNVSLASYAGQVILVRFYLSSNGQSVVTSATQNDGFFIDDITITSSTLLVNTTVTALAGSATSFALNATTAGTALTAGTGYYLRIQPIVGTKLFNFSAYDLVTAQTPAGSNYSGWVSQYSAVTGGPAGDYSQDGIANGYKYAFGLNPTIRNSPASIPAASFSGGNLTLSYTAPANISGVTYGAQSSFDLQAWTPITDTGSGNTHIFSVSASGHSKIFIRHYLTFAP